jgi:2-keto-4-pentenoate hydratase
LIDYTISYDQATGVFVTLASNITSTSYTATGLTAGKTYSFRVQARNAVGLSAPSAVATILCAAVPNAAVLSHDLSSTTTTQIALTWVDGATRGVPVIDYRVSYDQSSNNFVVLKNGVSSKSFIATGLLTGRTY